MKIAIEFTPDELLKASKSGLLEALFNETKLAENITQISKPEGKKDTTKAPENKPQKPPEPEKTENEDPTEAIPTVVELRAKAQEKGTTPEGKKAIKALLDKIGSKSISDIPEGKRAAFLRDLEAL